MSPTPAWRRSVPNRNSPPAILLRESYRDAGKVRKRTLANLSKWPSHIVEGLRILLKGGTAVPDLTAAFDIIRSRPHGHVAAVLGTVRKLRLDRLIASAASPDRERVIALIVARILAPSSKLATARGLAANTARDSLAEMLGIDTVDEDELYAAMDWLLERQGVIEQRLAKRHLSDGALVLYDLSSTWLEGRCCPLAKRGYSRDGKRGKLQIVFGLLCNREGCPIAVEVEGNTADPRTVVDSPGVGEEHLAAGGHGTPLRNAAQFKGCNVGHHITCPIQVRRSPTVCRGRRPRRRAHIPRARRTRATYAGPVRFLRGETLPAQARFPPDPRRSPAAIARTPGRSTPLPERPSSSSITIGSAQPSSRARSTRPYCRRRLSLVVLQLILRRLPDIDHGLAGEMLSGDLAHRPSPCPWPRSRRPPSLAAPPRAAVPSPVGQESPVSSA